tara:strand:- start:1237 stop:2052 length:816 start_codon:yes stop_codon:yes gene_type:complete
MEIFKYLDDYSNYLKNNPFHRGLNIDLKEYGDLKTKHTDILNLDPGKKVPHQAELDDLIRLHYLITSRKVTTILEFGVGKSTYVFNDALEQNKSKYLSFVKNNLRRSNPFECHSIDNNKDWIKHTKKDFPYLDNVVFYHSECEMSTFNSRVCTFYKNIPNVCPDFIYLDAPDQWSPVGDIRGVSTNHPDRLPMSADILALEHFLLPGTMIVLDGRTANARFLKCNFQRDWDYYHDSEFDQHFFELNEDPLGKINKEHIEFSKSLNDFNQEN